MGTRITTAVKRVNKHRDTSAERVRGKQHKLTVKQRQWLAAAAVIHISEQMTHSTGERELLEVKSHTSLRIVYLQQDEHVLYCLHYRQ